jgi:hypothetical protein
MFDIALDFEKAAKFLHTAILVVPGLIMGIAGLWLWLAGSSWHKLFAAAFTAIIAVLISAIMSLNIFAIAIIAILALLAGGLFSRLIIALSAAITASIIAFLVIYNIDIQPFPSSNRYCTTISEKMDVPQSVKFINDYSVFAGREVLNIAKSLQSSNTAIICGCGAVFLGFGLLLSKLTTALLTSLWGILLIAKGMILLLLYKGTFVITRVSQNTMLYFYIFAGMLAFGIIVQLLICPAVFKKSTKTDSHSNKNDGEHNNG